MKTSILVVVFLIALMTGCASVEIAPVPGNTVADVKLQRDVLNHILLIERALKKECKAYSITDTEAIEPYQGAGSKWKERWTLDRCGLSVKYDIEFTPFATDTISAGKVKGTLIGIPARLCQSKNEIEPNCSLQPTR
jgi:hypothetical protein